MSIRNLCIAFLLPFVAPVLQGQEPTNRILRTIPIRDLIGVASPLSPPLLGSFLGFGNRDVTHSVLAASDRRLSIIDVDDVQGMMVNELCPKAFEDGHVSLTRHGSVLFLTGTEAAVKEVDAALQALRRALIQPVRVRASLYRIPDARELPAFAAADALAALTAQLPLVWSAETTVNSGLQAALVADRRTRYVRDFEVEVAQSSHVGDPKVDELFEGVHLVAEPHALVGTDDLVLYGQFAFGEQHGPIETRDTGVKGYPSIDVPEVDVNSGSFSGRIANGGALLMSVRSPQGYASSLLLVVQAATVAAAQPPAAEFAFFPITALTSDALRHYIQRARSPEVLDRLMLMAGDTDSDYFGPLNTDELSSMLSEADDEADGLRAVHRSHVVVRGAQRIKFTNDLLRSLQQRWLTNTQVEVQTRLLPGEVGTAALEGAALTPATELLQAVSFPALAGRAHVFVSGRETTAIADYDVEIAQKATANNPIIDNPFSGLIVSCLPYPEPEPGMVGARLDIDATHVPLAPRRPLEQSNGGDLQATQSSAARFTHNGGLVPGREIVFGHGPIVRVGGQGRRTQISARISVR